MPMPADADADADAMVPKQWRHVLLEPDPAPGAWQKLGQPRAVDGASGGASADLALPVR